SIVEYERKIKPMLPRQSYDLAEEVEVCAGIPALIQHAVIRNNGHVVLGNRDLSLHGRHADREIGILAELPLKTEATHASKRLRVARAHEKSAFEEAAAFP